MKACSKIGATLIAVAILAACQDGLIYSERTSINLASARVNDDPATPVAIKFGFDRDVVTVAPPIGGTGNEPTTAMADGSPNPSFSANSMGTPDAVTEPDPSLRGSSAEGTVAEDCNNQGSGRTAEGEAVSQFSTFSVNVGHPFVNLANARTDQRQLWVHSRFASGAAALEIACKPRVVAAIMGLPTTQELAARRLLELDENDRATLCELTHKEFNSLTPEERDMAGKLTRYLSLYDSEDHAEFREACESPS